MDKKYTDSEVRGERSDHPDKSYAADEVRKLFFTENAQKKYDILTGSQKTFIDRELDDLRLSRSSSVSRKDNSELQQKIVFEEQNNQVIVTDILYDDYRNSKEYKKYSTVYITDISCSDEIAQKIEELNKSEKTQWVLKDHHKTSLPHLNHER